MAISRGDHLGLRPANETTISKNSSLATYMDSSSNSAFLMAMQRTAIWPMANGCGTSMDRVTPMGRAR